MRQGIEDMIAEGKVVIVTGGATGLGRAIVDAFLEKGAIVYSFDITEAAWPPNAAVKPWAVDLRDEAAINAAFHRVYQEAGRMDCLVNNAGINYRQAPLEAMSAGAIDNIFSVNVRGTILCAREYVKYAKIRKYGNIINISSNAAMKGNPYESLYTSTKWAMRGLTMSWHLELQQHGIAVNEVEPGVPIKTKMSELVYYPEDREKWVDPAEISSAFPAIAFAEEPRRGGRHIDARSYLESQY